MKLQAFVRLLLFLNYLFAVFDVDATLHLAQALAGSCQQHEKFLCVHYYNVCLVKVHIQKTWTSFVYVSEVSANTIAAYSSKSPRQTT